MTSLKTFVKIHLVLAGIAHLVERHLAKVEVASSSLVARSKEILILLDEDFFFYRIFGKSPGHTVSTSQHTEHVIQSSGIPRVPANSRKPLAECREAHSGLAARPK